jgi:predicted Mrr-cat superfamily restriction endonuclease
MLKICVKKRKEFYYATTASDAAHIPTYKYMYKRYRKTAPTTTSQTREDKRQYLWKYLKGMS